MGTRTKLTAGLAATMMIATACAPFGGNDDSEASALPPAPAVHDLRPTTPVIPDDGLHRVVVTVPEALFEASEVESVIAEGAVAESATDARAADEGSATLTLDLLAEVPPNSTLVADDGILGYLDGAGVFVPLLGSEGSAGAAGDDLSPFDGAGSISALLSSLPGVQSVHTITETSYAVTATSLDAIEALGVGIADDAPFALTTDPYEPYQWALENSGDSLSGVGSIETPTQAPDADVDGLEARSGATGRGVVVAVVDSGVDFSHSDLAHAAWTNAGEDCGGTGNGIDDDGNGFVDDCAGWDFGEDDPEMFDGGNDSHGTHVAGIIAAKAGNGVGISGIAPDAQIMDLKVSDRSGMIPSSAIARAIRYAADNGADVINLSLGSLPGTPLESVSQIAEAADYAGSKGVLLVAAAGNNAVSLDDSPVYPASFDVDNMLVVAATNPSDRRASFSNTGSAVDLFAPGELILSTIPGDQLAFQSGTSQASPIVAASAALVLEAEGTIGTSSLIDRVVGSADFLDHLSGLASNPLRLNSARAIGLRPDDSGDGGAVTIRGLAADEDGHVSATVSIGDLGGQFDQPFHWEASLLAVFDDAPFAITGHPVTISNPETGHLESLTTDRRGAVFLADDVARSAEWSTALPPGSYALMVEAVPRTDPTVRLGDGFLARFNVGGDPSGTADGDPPASNPDTSDQGDDTTGVDPEDGADVPDTNPTDDPGSVPTTTVAGAGDADQPGTNDDGSTEPPAANVPDDDAVPASDVDEDDEPREDDESEEDEDPDDSSELPSTDGRVDGEDSDLDEPEGEPADIEESDDPEEDGTDGEGETIDLGSDEASAGEWSVTRITPRTGEVDTENLVELFGTFPEPVVVWFGDTAAEVMFESEDLLMVRTRRHAAPETVDVSLRTRADGEVLTLPDAYSFFEVGDDPSVVETEDGSGEPGGTGDDGGDPVFGIDPDDGIVVDDAPPLEDGAGGNEDDVPRSGNRQARFEILGAPRELPNGLTGVPISGLDTIGGVPACDEDLCRTRRV